jgi:hypothetical protein
MSLWEQLDVPEKRRAARRVVFMYRCTYCTKYFNTFSYATAHMNECHRRDIDAHRMTYPILLRSDERFVVILEKMPKKRGYLRKPVKEP